MGLLHFPQRLLALWLSFPPIDLWAKKDLGKSTGTFSAKVPSQAVVVLRVTR